MSETETVRVHLQERSYDILIGSGQLAEAGGFVRSRTASRHAVVITDAHVDDPHARRVTASLERSEIRCEKIVVPAGEASKSVAMAERLWTDLLRRGADRQSLIVAVGGGVIGDLAGFVAATFARGLDFVQVPTTLLAQVDSSVGGKVGINLPAAKNMVGSFKQPLGVLIDIDVLATLPLREYRSGLAEVVKYGVIMDAPFFAYLEEHVAQLNDRDPLTLRSVIARCCGLKAAVVEEDERETSGRRAILNYGHTFCHAIEAVTGYGRFLHGEAVSIGMLCASRLAESLQRIDASATCRQQELLVALGLPIDVPDVPHEQLLEAMQRDKKVERGRLRFVLPASLGHVELVADVDTRLVEAALHAP